MNSEKMRVGLFLFAAIVLLLLPVRSSGQELASRRITLSWADVPADLQRKWQRGMDSLALREGLNQWVLALAQQGYPEVSLDSLAIEDGQPQLTLYRGPRYWLRSVDISGLSSVWAQQARLHKYPRKPEPLVWDQVQAELQQALDIAQDEGFPFANFELTSLRYQPQGQDLYADLHYHFEAGPEIRLDSIYMSGNYKEPDPFLWGIMRLQPGDLFSQSQIEAIPTLLNNTLYFEGVTAPQIDYLPGGRAQLRFDVKQKKSSQFDLLVGLLPPPANSPQRLQLTGSADITLVSPFKQGEVLGLKFQKLPGSSQLAEVSVRLPYLLRTPLQVEAQLHLQKQEELFQNLSYEAGLLYHFSPYLSARFALQGRNSRLLLEALTDTSRLRPEQLDGNRNLYGIGFGFQQLDYRNNPSKGIDASVLLSVGAREVQQNILLAEARPAWYQNVPERQPIRELSLQFDAFFSPAPRQVIYLGNKSYWLGMQRYLRNDQRQLGGVYSLRGFNENQYFADLYSILTLEYRLQLERDSYLFGFVDAAYLEDQVSELIRRPLGTGIGMQYGTQAGIITIVYGIGRSEDQAFQPGRGRVHIGLVNQF